MAAVGNGNRVAVAGKLPLDSFDYYFSLGEGRTYAAVAAHFGCSKKAVTKRATKEGWQERLDRIHQVARQASDKKAVEVLESMQERHQKLVRVLQAKALETLKARAIETGSAAARVLVESMRQEERMAPPEPPKPRNEPRPSSFSLWVESAPTWHLQIVLPPKGKEEDSTQSGPFIRYLVTEVCRWVDHVATQRKLDATLPFHELVLAAFAADGDQFRREEMKGKLLRLHEELERHAELLAGTGGRDLNWRTGVFRATGESNGPAPWREAYPECDATDGIAYLVKRLEDAVEPTGGVTVAHEGM
jgi:transposase